MTADDWIEQLQLEPHPEGGYFRRTYTAKLTIPCGILPTHRHARPLVSAIYYLLKGDQCSRLHRLKSDEIWHFYAGSPLSVHVIDSQGEYQTGHLGVHPQQNQQLQQVIPAGHWFGATVDDIAHFSLVGCTVAPGFDFADFELADRQTLIRQYPQYAALIARLT